MQAYRVLVSTVVLGIIGCWATASATPPRSALPAAAASSVATAPGQASALSHLPLATLQKRAEAGNVEAEIALAERLSHSSQPAQQRETVALFHAAAEKGNADAEWQLGKIYLAGIPSAGIRRDIPAALKWMHRAATNPRTPPRRVGMYGFVLAVSNAHAGNRKGMRDGVEWLRRSADAGSASSMLLLGTIYFGGKSGVTQSMSRAEYWLARSAEHGNADAQESLGVMQLGLGKIQSSLYWLRASAKQGNVTAESTLAMALITGEIGKARVPKDPAEGIRWAQKAIARHNAVGYYALGNAYQYGAGEPKDPAKAWYNFAVAKRLDTTHQIATAHIDEHMSEVATTLSATQLDELQAAASKVAIPQKKPTTTLFGSLSGPASS